MPVAIIWNGCQSPYSINAYPRLAGELGPTYPPDPSRDPAVSRVRLHICGYWRPLSGGVILVDRRPVWANSGAPPGAAVEEEISAYARTRQLPPLNDSGRSANGVHWTAPQAYTGAYPMAYHEHAGCSPECRKPGERTCQQAITTELREWFSTGRVPAAWPRNGDALNP